MVRVVIERLVGIAILAVFAVDATAESDGLLLTKMKPGEMDVQELQGKPHNDAGGRSNTCPATALGVLPAAGGLVVGDTSTSTNDFMNDGEECNYYSDGASGPDEIFEFTPEASGVWSFDTCDTTGWDTSLMIREETGGGCPGDWLACDGDGCTGQEPYESLLEAFLLTGTTYYLVVDSWSTVTSGAFEVNYALVQPPCTDDPDCDDAVFCNGAEICDLGSGGKCLPGTPPCELYQVCDEDIDQCVDPEPCVEWLAGTNGPYFFATANVCENAWVFDDIELQGFHTRELEYYGFDMRSRETQPGASPIGTPYSVETALWTVMGDGNCLPEAIIPGSECTLSEFSVQPSGAPPQHVHCEPASPVTLPDNSGDTDRCEIDFFVGYRTAELGAGFSVAGGTQLVGGPAADDDFGFSIFCYEQCPAPTGIYEMSWFGDEENMPADFGQALVCTVPVGACCVPASPWDCYDNVTEEECIGLGGTWISNAFYAPVDCGDSDEDGIPTVCGDNCPDDSNAGQEDCDAGLTPEGDACESDPAYEDCYGYGTCNGEEIAECPPEDPNCDDCNGNGVPDECDINGGQSEDLIGPGGAGGPDGVPDECQEDSDGDGINNAADNCPAKPNGPDLGTCTEGITGPCNANDECDTSPGSGDGVCSLAQDDGDGDGVGDACDNCPDHYNPLQENCDIDETGDVCAIAEGASDCNGNGMPDLCELTGNDCNGNSAPDDCDISEERSEDCNDNDVPDECDVPPSAGYPDGLCTEDCSEDCTASGLGNGIPDECEPDCQPVGMPGHGTADSCDIATGTSPDVNDGGDGNGVPDECDPGACCYVWDPYYMCVETTETDCTETWGEYNSVYLGLDTQCPTEGVSAAEHLGTVVLHITDPTQECGEGTGRNDCVPGDPIDPWKTAVDAVMCHRFDVVPDSPPIPADFFGPGSDPFDGAVCLEGQPLGPTEFGDFGEADTLIRRTGGPSGTGDPFDRCALPSGTPAVVEAEVVALNLKSTAPIIITYNGGQDPEQWDVTVDLSEVTPSPGSITAAKTHCNGGTYNSELHVQPRFTFAKVADPGEVRVLDTGLEGIPYVTLAQEDNPPWIGDVLETLGLPSEICTDFHPGVEDAAPTLDCDCNLNDVRDKCDVESCPPDEPTCQDCNANEIPDECDPDTDADGVPDECDVCPGGDDAADSDEDGVPDACDTCSGGDDNVDTDGDGVADDCDPCPDDNPDDADSDGVCTSDDNCRFFNPEQTDCQPNSVGDGCDISDGTSQDANGNGVPDECENAPAPEPGGPPCDTRAACTGAYAGADCVAGTCYVPKNRYLSIDPTTNTVEVAYRLRVIDSATYPDAVGKRWWVGPPVCYDYPNGDPVPGAQTCEGGDRFGWVSGLTDAPVTRVWTEVPLHIADCGTVPLVTYEIHATFDGGFSFSEPLVISTIHAPQVPQFWGDLTGGPENVDPASGDWLAPEGSMNMGDIQAAIRTFENVSADTGCPPRVWVDVEINQVVNLGDVQFLVMAFEGVRYAEIEDLEFIGLHPVNCP